MREMMPYIWIGIIIFAAAVRLNTHSLAPVWLIPAGLAAFILSLVETEVWLQALLFFALSAILLVLYSAVLKKITFSTKKISLAGRTAIVTVEINNYKNAGMIRLNGRTWNAKAEEDDIIYEAGLIVTVVETVDGDDGLKVICSR